MEFKELDYYNIKASNVHGRYVVNEQIIAFINMHKTKCVVETEGYSVEKRPIQSISIGHGKQRLLLWSQMHGNESTTTKAVLDLIVFLNTQTDYAKVLLEKCTLKILPLLNPDGAQAYTRVNANQIDLNRDAQNRSQPESKLLREVYEAFQPHYCFNLHDQRTIYNVGATAKSATISFLAPSSDLERSISTTRLQAIQLISAINISLQKIVPNQIGRYDDAFNANCVGDTFQMLNTPTLLFEAGHFHEDYEREKTREYIFYALVSAIDVIAKNSVQEYDQSLYFEIPENEKRFFDILVKNVPSDNRRIDVGILYVEKLENNKINFVPTIEKEGDLSEFFGHKTYDCLVPEDVKSLKNTVAGKLFKI